MSSNEYVYLSLDQGGHASRAMAFDQAGLCLASASYMIQTNHPYPHRVEHDPGEIVRSLHSAIHDVLQQLGDRGHNITAAGLVTQRSSMLCWDTQCGRALSPVLSWQDTRAESWLSQFEGQQSMVHQRSGLFISPHYGTSKFHWCLQNLPEVIEAYQEQRLGCGPLASYLLFQLLDESPMLADPAHASRTLLYDTHKLDWSVELLNLFNIDSTVLPVCVESRFDFGTLTHAGQRIPLKVCTGDQSAAVFARGWPLEEEVQINLGTGAFVLSTCSVAEHIQDKLLGGILFKDSARTIHALEGTVNGAGSALSYIRQQLGMDEHELLQTLPQCLQIQRDIPLFINGVAGLGTPFLRPHFPSYFTGESGTKQKLRAVLESILFLIMENLSMLRQCKFRAIERIHISGGLSRLDGMCQLLANLAQLPVWRSVQTEASALGLAFLLATPEDGWSHGQATDRFLPQQDAPLDKRYQRWQQAMNQALQELPT